MPLLSLALVGTLASIAIGRAAPASQAPTELAIHHEPPGCLVPEQWSQLSARLEPAAAVAGAWLHFRQQGSLYWYLLVLHPSADSFEAVLPRPLAAAGRVEYAFEALARSGSRSWSPCHVVDVASGPSCRGRPAAAARTEPVGPARTPGAPEWPPGFAPGAGRLRFERTRSSQGTPVCSAPDSTPHQPREPGGPQHEPEAGATLAPGTRLRVTTLRSREVGSLLAVDPMGLTLAREAGEPVRIPREAIRRVEASLGRSSEAGGRWAAYGALIGLGIGCGVSAILSDTVGHGDSNIWSDMALGGLLFGLPAGAAVGYAAAPREQWEPRPLPGVSAAGRRGGLTLTIAVRF